MNSATRPRSQKGHITQLHQEWAEPLNAKGLTQITKRIHRGKIKRGSFKKNHLLLIETKPNKYLRVPKAHVNSQQSSSQTPHELCLSLADRKKKKLREFYIGHLFMLGAQRTTGGEEGVSSFKLLFLEPALLFTQGGSPPRRKLRLHKARVQDPAASRTMWVGGTVVVVFFIVIICDL